MGISTTNGILTHAGATLVTKSQPLSRESLAVTTTVGEISRPLITHYVTGSLSALVLLLGALVIVLLMMYLCKFRKRKPSKYF